MFGGAASVASAAAGWQPTGSMSKPRHGHATAALQSGGALVVSGFSSADGFVSQSERWDPATGIWSLVAPSLMARMGATATTLADGRVLVVGGTTDTGVTNSAELYDPRANTWTATGSMADPRGDHTATVLADGKVLVTGGVDDSGDPGTPGASQDTAEVYDPSTGTWSSAGSFGETRRGHQAVRLANGHVLIVGGHDLAGGGLAFRNSARIYDPEANVWTAVASLTLPRSTMAAGVLPDGSALIANGFWFLGAHSSSFRFDPTADTWSSAGSTGVTGPNAAGVTLGDGRFLLTSSASTGTPLYDATPVTGGWTARYATAEARSERTLTMLADGRVLIAGGVGKASAEVFTPPAGRTARGGDFPAVRSGDPVEQDVTIRSSGVDSLVIDDVVVAGADAAAFSVVSDTCTGQTLPARATCVVRVRFAPSEVRTYAAELAVTDNAESSPAIPLSGERQAPAPEPEPEPKPEPQPEPTPEQPVAPVAPPAPAEPAPPASCARPYVALVGLVAAGTPSRPTVKLSGLAAPSSAGQTVTVLRGTRRVGTARVRTNGRISATVAAPKGIRARNAARYRFAITGSVRSAAMKATRRVGTSRQTTLSDGRVRVSGTVAGVKKPTTLTVRSRPVCGAVASSSRIRSDRHGRFRVTLVAPPAGVPAAVHRIWLSGRSVTLPVVTTAKR